MTPEERVALEDYVRNLSIEDQRKIGEWGMRIYSAEVSARQVVSKERCITSAILYYKELQEIMQFDKLFGG